MLRPFVYLAPHSLAEAVEMRRVHDNANFLAGGTALLVAMERGQASAETIIDLKHIKQLREIELTVEGELKIGALTTLREIIDSQLIRSYAPVLVQTAQLTATPQVRNLGTIGGNIASGLAAADLATALIALNAHVLVATNSGEVRMPLNDFLGDTKVISQQETRIISAVILSGARGHASYQKLMVRNAADVPLANVAIWTQTDSGQVTAVRIAAGNCAGRPARLMEAETLLRGQIITPEAIQRTALTATETVQQTGDSRASEAYRRRMVGVLTRRALTQLLEPL